MRAALMALAWAATVLSQPADQHTWHRKFDDHGRIRMEAEYRNGLPDGVYRSWYPDGRIAEVRHYVNGHEQGLQQAWAPDGQLYINYEMKDGRRYGLVNAAPCLPVSEETP